jgi:hypothetical protein
VEALKLIQVFPTAFNEPILSNEYRFDKCEIPKASTADMGSDETPNVLGVDF